MPPTISVCITINDRSLDTLDQVFWSLRGQAHDQLVIVLDQPTRRISDFCKTYWKYDPRTTFVDINRPPGWRSPVKAWNKGYEAVTSDLLYCFSSETVQAPGNIALAKSILQERPAVLFGRAECSCGPNGQEVNWQGTAPGNLLCDAAHPRPLGFIWAAPLSYVQSIGGWDEAFDGGYWYDENDFFFRLWNTSLPFVFDDSISGVHLHHDRPVLATIEGAKGIQHNATLMSNKYGSLDPMGAIRKLESRAPGRTDWTHM